MDGVRGSVTKCKPSIEVLFCLFCSFQGEKGREGGEREGGEKGLQVSGKGKELTPIPPNPPFPNSSTPSSAQDQAHTSNVVGRWKSCQQRIVL